MNFNFVTVHTAQLEASITFYTEVLGFEVKRRFQPAPGIDIAFLENKGSLLEFVQIDNAPKYEGHGISLGFSIEDMTSTIATLKAAGVSILREPMVFENGTKVLQALDTINNLELGFVEAPKDFF